MNVTSVLESVTLFREGAICLRRARLEQGEIPSQVRMVGLPLTLEPTSLRARVVSGTVRVLDVRCAFDATLTNASDEPQAVADLKRAKAELARITTARERLAAEIDELTALLPKPLEPRRGAAPRAANVEAALALSDFTDAKLAERFARQATLAREQEAAVNEVTLRERRLHEASSAVRTERAQLSRAAVVTLSGETKGPLTLTLEYQVHGARWVPNYQLRLDAGDGGGKLTMRAAIAQATGEDWRAVSLSLSTASLNRRTDAPTLKSLRIGRAQQEPPKSGWREPPPGLDSLFDAYESFASPRHAPPTPPAPSLPPPPAPPPRPTGAPKAGSLSRAGALARSGGAPGAPSASFAALGGARPAPAPMAKAMKKRSAARDEEPDEDLAELDAMSDGAASFSAHEEREELAKDAFGEGGGGGWADDSPPPEPAGPSGDTLDYDRLVMGGADGANGPRGRLAPAPSGLFEFHALVSVNVDVVMMLVARASTRAQHVHGLPTPSGCVIVSAQNHFDYRYDAAGAVDVESTGTWVTVAVMDCNVGLKLEFVAVPSVEPKVFRTLLIDNATAHALLPGPVDVSAGDEFLMTTSLPAIAPGAKDQRLGLGVEEAIKIARKTNYKETTGGFLGGSTVLPHDIEIEINNRLAVPALLEVRERLPTPEGSEKDVKVEEAEVRPPWEKAEGPVDGAIIAGARRWKITVPAGQKSVLTAQFTIRIPADRMLVGGNRRA